MNLQEIDKSFEKKSDKGWMHNYFLFYDTLFLPFKDKKLKILEIGIKKGSSLRTWKEYFKNSEIFGIDIDSNSLINEDRIKSFLCNSSDPNDIKKLNGLTFDIIIDDGSHVPQDQKNTFNNFFNLVNSNGLYIIEDIKNVKTLKNEFIDFPITEEFKKNISYKVILDTSIDTNFKRDSILFIIRKK